MFLLESINLNYLSTFFEGWPWKYKCPMFMSSALLIFIFGAIKTKNSKYDCIGKILLKCWLPERVEASCVVVYLMFTLCVCGNCKHFRKYDLSIFRDFWRPVPVVKSMSFWNDKSGQGSDMKMASSSLDLLSPKVKVSKKTEDSLVIYWHWYPYPWRDLSWWLKWDLNQGQVSSKEHFKQRCDHYVSSDWSTNQMMAFDVQVN